MVELDRLGNAAKDLAGDELAHQVCGQLAADDRPDEAQQRGTSGRIPRLEKERDHALAQPVDPGLEQAGDELRRVDRKLDRGEEHALLRPEIVGNHRGVDTRPRGDAADGRTVVALLAEVGAGRRQDLLPRAACAGPAAGSWHPRRVSEPRPASRPRNGHDSERPLQPASTRGPRAARRPGRRPVSPRRCHRNTGRRETR